MSLQACNDRTFLMPDPGDRERKQFNPYASNSPAETISLVYWNLVMLVAIYCQYTAVGST